MLLLERARVDADLYFVLVVARENEADPRVAARVCAVAIPSEREVEHTVVEARFVDSPVQDEVALGLIGIVGALVRIDDGGRTFVVRRSRNTIRIEYFAFGVVARSSSSSSSSSSVARVHQCCQREDRESTH